MASFGVGLYFLAVIWFVTFMLCWVSVKTGHYVGKVAAGVSLLVTIILVALPKGDVRYVHSANFYDKLFVPRFAILSFLLVSVVVGLCYCFVNVCLAPIETRKVRTLGCVN